MRYLHSYLCVVAFITPLAGATWSGLRIVPQDVYLAKEGDTQRFLVLAFAANGQEEDVTSQCQISSPVPDVVSINPTQRLLRGKRRGQSKITANLKGLRATTLVKVGDHISEVNVRFSPDVISVLTIKGCNSSGCHGSPAGQSGFKLSLFGYDTAADHEMIVSRNSGRRVDLANAENSLLLRKPLFDIPHGGGRLFTRESEEYRTLLKWLQQGARLDSDGARLTRLEIYPSEEVLVGKGARLPSVVIGRLSDGTTRDMTREVRYSSSDEAVASVSSDGTVTAVDSGVATILARGLGGVAASQVGVILEHSGADFLKPPATNFVDELVFEKQKRLNVPPAAVTTDREFVRRVFIDTIGLLPTPEEVKQFLSDSRPDKRSRLIESLLQRPEYAAFWTVRFEDWFRNNQLNSQGRSMGKFKEWLIDRLTEDEPYDQMVRELITSEGDTFQQPAANFWHPATDFMLKKFDVKKATPTVSRLFLGIRMECAECHNHPLENFTQDDFYGLSAFFARLRVKHGTGEYRRTWYLDEEGEVEHPVLKKPVQPKFLGGETPQILENEDRRISLAAWVTSARNPYFARATVNRIWHEYFQTGIVEPFDDLRSTNPPTNRELLDRLATYFIDSGFRLKSLQRLILNSRTYQLSSRPATPRSNETLERLLFARYETRKLTAEVQLDAISQVTGVAHRFTNYPEGTRAMDLYTADAPDSFLVTFGFPRRDIICERAKSPTLGQALHMINGDTVLKKVQAQNNVLSSWLTGGWTDDQIVNAIYERAYSRPPSDNERGRVRDFVRDEEATGRSRRRALEGVLWTVLNSKEFQVNH